MYSITEFTYQSSMLIMVLISCPLRYDNTHLDGPRSDQIGSITTLSFGCLIPPKQKNKQTNKINTPIFEVKILVEIYLLLSFVKISLSWAEHSSQLVIVSHDTCFDLVCDNTTPVSWIAYETLQLSEFRTEKPHCILLCYREMMLLWWSGYDQHF